MCGFQVQKIEEIGGRNVQKAVKFSMEAVMSDQLSQKVVWVLGAETVPKLSRFAFPRLIVGMVINCIYIFVALIHNLRV